MKRIYMALLMALIFASTVSSEVIISEIMYDPAGDETKQEWIELYNGGESPIDLTGWKIRDGSTSRALIPYSGGMLIAPFGFAVLARDGQNFSSKYPGYASLIIESSFSLTNSGKDLAILDNNSVEKDFFHYEDIADEGYSIELNNSLLDNSDIRNWRQGNFMGNPGTIDTGHQSIPEYNFPGLLLGMTFVVFLFAKLRK